MNIRPGPAVSSWPPAAAMAGMITIAAIMAPMVSNSATYLALLGMDSFLEKYDP